MRGKNMIVCIVEQHDIVDSSGTPTGEQEPMATYAVDLETDNILSLPKVSPHQLNVVYSPLLETWVVIQ